MFEKILCANDGSERAFRAFVLAIKITQENNSELHMVSVEEIDYMPEFVEEVRQEIGTAAADSIRSSSGRARWPKKAA